MSKNYYFEILEATRLTQMSHFENGDSSVVCFVGEPGIGKTQTVGAYAKHINYGLDTIILSQMAPVDVGGVYAPDHEKRELIHYITTRMIGGDIPHDKDGLIIFLDELAGAAQDVQVAIQSIIQDRVLSGRKASDRVMFVCATNLPEHTNGANDLIKSLASRLLFVTYKFEPKSWFEKARTEWEILPEVYAFNMWQEGRALNQFERDSTSLSYPDPRGWNKVNHTLRCALQASGSGDLFELFKVKPDLVRLILAGQLGEGMANEFAGFMRNQGELPTVKEVFQNPAKARIPKSSDAQHAIIFNIDMALSRQKKEKGRPNQRDIDATYDYLVRLPKPMAVLGYRVMANSTEEFTTSSKHFAFREKFAAALSA